MSSIYSAPLSSSSSLTLTNITFDDSASSLKYTQGWNESLSSQAFNGTLHSTSSIGDVVILNLPANAVAIYYFGLKATSGSLCAACLDCDNQNTSIVDILDGHSDTQSNEPTLLYSMSNLDPSTNHSFALVNLPDERFGNTSTISLDSFIVTIQQASLLSSTSDSSLSSSLSPTSSVPVVVVTDVLLDSPTLSTDSPAVPTPPAPSDTDIASPSSAQILPSSVPLSSASPSSTGQPGRSQNDLNITNTVGKLKLSSPLILVAVILVSLFIVFTSLYALLYFLRRRRRKAKAPSGRIQVLPTSAAAYFAKEGGNKGSQQEGKTNVKVAKNTMVEQLVPDRPRPAYRMPHGPSPLNPTARRNPGARPPPIMTEFMPGKAPRSHFPPRQPPLGNQVVASRGTGLADDDDVRNPFVQAELEAREKMIGGGGASAGKGPLPGFSAFPPPYSRHTEPVENPFAVAEMEANMRTVVTEADDKTRSGVRDSMASQYSQADHDHPTLPTPWVNKQRTDNTWELV